MESNVEILALVNNDTTGQNKKLCGGNTIFDMSNIEYISRHGGCFWKKITGEFVDTSSEKVKYDFKDAEYNFRTTVKNITPKNQKHLK